MNKKFLLLIAGILALFPACSDNVVLQDPESPLPPTPPNIAVETKANLTVRVFDAITGTPLDAKVTLLSTGDAITADAAGTAVFDSLHIGYYSFIIEKDGYASGATSTEIYHVHSQMSENIFIASNTLLTHSLAPLSSGLSGYLFYTDSTGKKNPAVGAKVRVQLNGDFLKKVYEIDVDADGKYTFAKLPAVGQAYQLFALEYLAPNGVTYKTKSITATQLVSGATAHADNEAAYLINDDISLFTLLGYTNTVDSVGIITFEFSDAIDTIKTGTGSIYLSNDQVANVYWGSDRKTVILAPRGKWTAGQIDVSFNLKSVGGKTYNESNSVIVLGDILKGLEFTILPAPIGYKDIVDSTDALVFKFSDTIDVAKVAASWVIIRDIDYNNIAAKITWGGDSLRLEPIGGKWTKDFNVYFNNVKSIRGKDINTGVSISLKLKDPLLAVPFTLLDGYITSVNSKDTVVFEFSDTIDTKKLSYNAVTLTGTQSANIIWEGRKLIIVPVVKWSGNFYVYFNNDLTSVRGKTLRPSSKYISLKASDLSALKVTGLVYADTADFNSYQAKLRWNKVEGATEYRVFRKELSGSNTGNFVEIANSINDTTAFAEIPYEYCNSQAWCGGVNGSFYRLVNGGEVEFVVQAYNSVSQTIIDTLQAVKVFDKKTPRFNSTPTVGYGDAVVWFNGYNPEEVSQTQRYYLEYYLGSTWSTENNISVYYIYFSEPMDTTAALTVGFAPATLTSRLVVDKKWSTNYNSNSNPSDRYLAVALKVTAGDPITTNINSIYTISGLKDKRGNLFEITYTDGLTTPVTKNTLDFRFIADAP